MDTLTIRHLRVVAAIGDLGSISAAARALHISQPAVSKTLAEAEAILCASLFDRSARGVAPTPAGLLLLARGRLIHTELGHLTREIAALQAGEVGTVTVAALLVALPRLLPSAIARMRGRVGDCIIRVVTGTQDSLMGALRTGAVDFVVGRLPSHGERDQLVQEILYQDPIVIIARAGHPLLRSDPVDVSALAQASWVFPTADSSVFGIITDLFARHGLSLPRSHVESVSFELVRTLLLEHDMVAALPRSLVQAELASGSLVELGVSIPNAHLPVGITRRADRPLTPIVEAFLQCLRERP